MHNYTYGTTNNEFLHRKYCEQSKNLVLNHFYYPLKFLKSSQPKEHLLYRYVYRLVLCVTIRIVNLTYRGIS